ncbi:hypothetical protein M406DRAFT_329707 [Cryphonectria parasitica EP155]|uniref:Stc1 domain-containing protein n=1 Tax=Cryphonectria parasitica (strain ATCC 38755 / EP155) TaxID=660469 RepID=A0A9P4Y2N2_CRYP1|nr:uncharacterized protein M406DRAFT_329707 [Cryphonectria parasitica EP155]KAF3765849.1 hypothetical protein M406DRAFT_329707 [Cryphonectria parasitica EP155]
MPGSCTDDINDFVVTAGTKQMLRCTVDNKFERLDQFSQNQLNKYRDAKRAGRPAQLRCRKHIQGTATELKCDDCDEYKPLSEFSNASRKASNRSRRCRDCIAWTEADMAGTEPLPAPGAPRAPDEQDYGRYGLQDAEKLDKTKEEDFEDDLASMSINDSTSNTTECGYNHILTSTALETHNDRHQSVGHSSPAYNPSSTPSTPMVTSSSYHQQPRQPIYTAYGHNGEIHKRTQTLISNSDNTSGVPSIKGVSRRGGFVKFDNRRMVPDPPSYLVNQPAEGARPRVYFSDDSEDEA